MDQMLSSEQSISTEEVVKMVQEALTTYDADKTGSIRRVFKYSSQCFLHFILKGLFDFALESAGGSIESTRCTEDYDSTTASLSVFGIPLPNVWKPRVSPRAILEPGRNNLLQS